MKFWQLSSIADSEGDLILRIAASCPLWKKYECLFSNIVELVETQNREILDSIVDNDFVIAVLEKVERNLYLSADNWLRSWKFHIADKEISILDSYKFFGGEVVENVIEHGSVKVTPCRIVGLYL